MKFLGLALVLAVGAQAMSVADLESTWQPAGPIDFSKYLPMDVVTHRAFKASPYYKKNNAIYDVPDLSEDFDDICGIEHTGLQSLDNMEWIVGGHEAAPNQFPWLVTFIMDSSYLCTGSILSKNYILTAGHCTDGFSKYQVFVGAHNIKASSEPHRMVINSNMGIPNEGFTNDNTGIHDDIGLIKLPSPLEFNEWIIPTCMPTHSDVSKDFANMKTTITGWGQLGHNKRTNTLHFATDIPTISNKVCKKTYNFITIEHLCIDTSDGRGICFGDSGGPLNLPVGNNKYKQLGVASFLHRSCEDTDPRAYTRLTHYLDWVEKNSDITINSN